MVDGRQYEARLVEGCFGGRAINQINGMAFNISDTLITDLVDWGRSYYTGNLEGLLFFDPRASGYEYPRADVNLLIVLNDAPAMARERYDERLSLVIEVVLGGGFQVFCRIQTSDELQMLMEYHLPLLDIYMRDCQIVFDPDRLLANLKVNLRSSA